MKKLLSIILLLFLLVKGFSQTDNYDIIYHRVLWKVNPKVKYIEGEVTSYFKILKENTDVIYFDLLDSLNVDSIKQNNLKLLYTHSNNFIKITLPNKLEKNSIDSVTIYYKGEPSSLNKGFGSFIIDKHNDTPILWTLSEPYGAKEWWPCKQSLKDKIDSIDIYVETPLGNKVASNGRLIYEKIVGDKKITYWKHRYAIATYLVAIAVTNYDSYSQYAKVNDKDSVEILNYVYPENKDIAVEQTKFTIKVIELFSNKFIPYPFYKEKYGHAQFGWGGGMEHQTMSFMNNFKEPLITHELAHQWFGDYVTCGSWHHIWINEGFAVFCEYIAQEYLYPDNYLNWKKDRFEYILDKTKEGSVYVKDTTNINIVFNRALTYEKGGFIIQMLCKQIGDSAFFKGTRAYLQNNLFKEGYAVAEDYKQCLETAGDTNLTQFFNDWYYGEGYPNYTIHWQQESDDVINIKLSQKTTSSKIDFFSLKIPILLKGINKEKLIVLKHTQNSQEFVCDVDFVVTDIVFDPNYNILASHPANIILGIDDKLENKIRVMPNPVKDKINIKTNKRYLFSKVIILNSTGNIVQKEVYNTHTNKATINISLLNNGLYYVQIYTSNSIITKIIIKTN